MEKKDLGHYYYGQISWRPRPDIAPNTAEFTLINAFRRNVFSGSGTDGFPVKEDIILDPTGGAGLAFGDGALTGMLKYFIIDFSEKENWILGRALDPVSERKTILHTYPAPADTETEGPWKAGIKIVHRQALKEHVNNPGGGYHLETLVELNTMNGSPVAMAPVIVNAPQNSVFSFPVAAAAPDSVPLTCRLATDVEAGGVPGGFAQPGPPHVPNSLTVDAGNCMVYWDTTGAEPGQLWSYQVVVEDGKSKSCVDALIRIIEKAGRPPVCAGPDEIQYVTVGMPLSIDIVASDPDGLITVIEGVNLPLWATLNVITELPAADAVARISGIAATEDVGFNDMLIVATDDDGNQTVSAIKIKVDEGFDDDQPGVM